MFSSVRLGNSHLNLVDFYDLPLSSELVTLSGCSTGLSAVLGGDELVGMVRGLLYAGAHGVMVTLWDVHDRTTAHFMASFYKSLGAGHGKAAALRAAMQDLRGRHPHPYYWAPFVLVGKHL
jgi:CHAT domain-containing protein